MPKLGVRPAGGQTFGLWGIGRCYIAAITLLICDFQLARLRGSSLAASAGSRHAAAVASVVLIDRVRVVIAKMLTTPHDHGRGSVLALLLPWNRVTRSGGTSQASVRP